MKWMEIVRVRTTQENGEEVTAFLAEQIRLYRSNTGGTNGANILGVKHGLYSGDVAAVFFHGTKETPRKTREGYALAEAMHRFGSVEHAVWTVVPDSPPKEPGTLRKENV